MFERILVPTDGSERSQWALEAASVLARRLGANLVVLHVIPDTGMPPFAFDGVPVDARAVLHDLQLNGEGILKAALERVSTARTRLEWGRGRRVAEVIAHVASDEQVSLIVMGTHGREGLDRLFFGSITEETERLSSAPVLFVRRSTSGFSGLEPILVPVDGSEVSNHALEFAQALSNATGAALEVLHVVPDLELPTAEPRVTGETLKEIQHQRHVQGETVIQSARERIGPDGKTLLMNAHNERIDSAIERIAREEHAGMVVIGTHARGGLERLLLGSVAESFAHHSSLPMLIVRAAQAVQQV
jgi:nucleotide-binding universal stress UspA family protein